MHLGVRSVWSVRSLFALHFGVAHRWMAVYDAEKQAVASASSAATAAAQALEQPFNCVVSRCIIRNPAQGKQFVCYQFDVSIEGKAHSFFQRW